MFTFRRLSQTFFAVRGSSFSRPVASIRLSPSQAEVRSRKSLGEYANSCVGRERMFEYFSKRYATPGRLFRLNYAIDLRYGVLFDIASKVRDEKPIDVTM